MAFGLQAPPLCGASSDLLKDREVVCVSSPGRSQDYQHPPGLEECQAPPPPNLKQTRTSCCRTSKQKPCIVKQGGVDPTAYHRVITINVSSSLHPPRAFIGRGNVKSILTQRPPAQSQTEKLTDAPTLRHHPDRLELSGTERISQQLVPPHAPHYRTAFHFLSGPSDAGQETR